MKPLTKTIGVAAILLTIFGVSFYFFYKGAQGAPGEPLILTPAVIGRPLPQTNLVNVVGERLGDEKLRRGKVVLIFTLTECQPCDDENAFLKTVAGSRRDVSFYNVIPFGNRENALKVAQEKYALATYFDEKSQLTKALQVYQVPVKVFLEDGVIKKTWLDATIDRQAQADFRDWLSHL